MYTTIANNVSDVNDVNVVGNVSIVKYLDLPKKKCYAAMPGETCLFLR